MNRIHMFLMVALVVVCMTTAAFFVMQAVAYMEEGNGMHPLLAMVMIVFTLLIPPVANEWLGLEEE